MGNTKLILPYFEYCEQFEHVGHIEYLNQYHLCSIVTFVVSG